MTRTRPEIGVAVRSLHPPHAQGVVVDTFYEVGRGMHVSVDGAPASWWSADDAEVIIRRGPMPEGESTT